MTAVLFDLDGVLYEGERPIAGAADTVHWFQERGIAHLFVTNTTSRPRDALVEKLGRFGIRTEASRIFTPAAAAAHWLGEHVNGPVALFVPPATRPELGEFQVLAETDESGAAAVVIGDLGEGWDFKTLNRAFRLLMASPRPFLIALGMTRYWQAEDGLRLDVAPFVVALAHASGTSPIVLGKPAKAFFKSALKVLGVTAAETVMVGDDVLSDIKGAQESGMRAVLVKTGKYRPENLSGDVRPEAVLGSAVELPAWWERHAGQS